jgi:hypothetical protein
MANEKICGTKQEKVKNTPHPRMQSYSERRKHDTQRILQRCRVSSQDRMGGRNGGCVPGSITKWDQTMQERDTHLADNQRNTSGNLNFGLTVSLQRLTYEDKSRVVSTTDN